jgi:bifunctional UDP-N-acetylglucosamine pyrophosphorylase/glucosamine-1-phosphate N-acetyltransferase
VNKVDPYEGKRVSAPSVAIVLAAGDGTRMKSNLPKVLHPILGKAIILHVLSNLTELGFDQIVVVTSHPDVDECVKQEFPDVVFAHQENRNGTADAVQVGLEKVSKEATRALIVPGDTPLLAAHILRDLIAIDSSPLALLSAHTSNPFGYGRVVRNGGLVEAIVEEKDATDTQKRIQEVNASVYWVDIELLRKFLPNITTDNAQHEKYLTDIVKMAREDSIDVGVIQALDFNAVQGVNNRVQLAYAAKSMQRIINSYWMLQGVTIEDPETTWIELDVVLAADVLIRPNTHLRGKTSIAKGAVIGPDSDVTDCTVLENATVLKSVAIQAHIGTNATVGPFSYLRPGTDLHEQVKIGAYVEVKNSVVGQGSKVPHLSYVGDATIGKDTNIGAGTVFVNYDGIQKHRTEVGDAVRIGSDTMLVAPVRIGDGAYTAAGSVITDDVPAGAMAVARERQRNIVGWVKRKRPGTVSAKAAERDNS